jgi:hypothetical protein
MALRPWRLQSLVDQRVREIRQQISER